MSRSQICWCWLCPVRPDKTVGGTPIAPSDSRILSEHLPVSSALRDRIVAIVGQCRQVVSIDPLVERSLIGTAIAGIILINERTIIGDVAIITTITVVGAACSTMIIAIGFILDDAIAIDGHIAQRGFGNAIRICQIICRLIIGRT